MRKMVKFTIIFDIALLVAALVFLAVGDTQIQAFILLGIMLASVIAYGIVSKYLQVKYREAARMVRVECGISSLMLAEQDGQRAQILYKFAQGDDFSKDATRALLDYFPTSPSDPMDRAYVESIDYLYNLPSDLDRMYAVRSCSAFAKIQKSREAIEEVTEVPDV